METEKTFVLKLDADQVVNAMRNPKMIEFSDTSRKETLSVKVEPVFEDQDTHRYIIHLVTYKQSLKGMDKSKTEKSTSTVTWDLKNRSGNWVWAGEYGPRVKITGGYVITPKTSGCDLTLSMQAGIGLPVVGKLLEIKVVSEFQKEWVKYVDRLTGFIQKS